jgi:hypothetical protein
LSLSHRWNENHPYSITDKRLCFPVIYISAFPQDPRRNKLFVYAVFTLEIIQTIILTKSYFEIFASGFGDPEAYDRTGAIWFSVPFMSGIGLYPSFETLSDSGSLPISGVKSESCVLTIPCIPSIVAFLAEIFYALRLYLLSESYRVPIVVSVVCFSLDLTRVCITSLIKTFLSWLKVSSNPSRRRHLVRGRCQESVLVQPSTTSSI